MKAIVLSRVSTEEQKDAGNSLPAQDFRVEEYRKRLGYPTLEKFSFDESAWKDNRIQFHQVIELIKAQKEPVALICDKIDRLTRDFDHEIIELEKLRKLGRVEIHCVSDGIVLTKDSNAPDKVRFSMGVVMAKYYSDAISDNVKRAQEQMLRDGIYPSAPPFGYKTVRIDEDHRKLEPDPFYRQVVLVMFERYATGTCSMLELKHLIKKQFDVKLEKSRIHLILQNKFYIGIMTWKGQEYPHHYEHLVPDDIFDKVQAIRSGHHKKNFKYAGLPYIYRSMIKCAECGLTITPEKKKGKYVYYHCTEHNGKHGALWLTEDNLTDQFSDIFAHMQMPEDKLKELQTELLKTQEDKIYNYNKLVEHYRAEVDQWQKAIDENYRNKCTQSITQETYAQFHTEFTNKRDIAQEKLTKLQAADNQCYLTLAYLAEIAAHAVELFKSSERDEKRQLLSMTVQNLRLDGKKVLYDLQYPFDVIAEYAPRSAWLPLLDTLRNTKDRLLIGINDIKPLASNLGLKLATV